ncbi:MAG TPA: hypothetical protein VNH43_04175 [Vicinamibacteria bacterium]|nr:hypothetical protein [Vicinamibacteria bacterium]
MARERAKTFADRLPPVVPKEEDDISRLSDEMADILYPGRRPRPFRMGIAFDAFDGPGYERAVELARRSPLYHERVSGGETHHEAAFETAGAGTLRELFQIVGPRPGTDVLVDGKKAPYARELWLPLFWMFVREGD